jgi:group I intron endonuclease
MTDIIIYTKEWFQILLGTGETPHDFFPYNDFNKKNLLNQSRIYALFSKTDNKFYIGSAKDLYKRLNEHLNEPTKSNINMQKAILQHGINNFIIIILIYAGDSNELNIIRLLKTLENLYLKIVKIELLYNISLDAECPPGNHKKGVFKHSSEIIEKCRKARLGTKQTEETKRLIAEHNLGNKYTEESKALMSQNRKGITKGRPRNTEAIKKLLKTNEAKRLAIIRMFYEFYH